MDETLADVALSILCPGFFYDLICLGKLTTSAKQPGTGHFFLRVSFNLCEPKLFLDWSFSDRQELKREFADFMSSHLLALISFSSIAEDKNKKYKYFMQ